MPEVSRIVLFAMMNIEISNTKTEERMKYVKDINQDALCVKERRASTVRKQQLARCVGIISLIRKVVVFQSRKVLFMFSVSVSCCQLSSGK
jgi:hypothetical protein